MPNRPTLKARLRYFLHYYPLTLTCMAVIWYLCMFRPPSTPLDGITGIDKWAHTLMYLGTCSIIWWEFLRAHGRERWSRLLPWAIVGPIAMSGSIELAQTYLTSYRGGEWTDFGANCLGVVLAAALGHFVLRPLLCRTPKADKGE